MFSNIWRNTQKVLLCYAKCLRTQNVARCFRSGAVSARALQSVPCMRKSVLLTKTFANCMAHSKSLRYSHSLPESITIGELQIKTLPAKRSNLMYLIIDLATNEAAVVDPVEPDLVMQYVQAIPNINLTSILTTHFHYNHSSGNSKLVQLAKGYMEVWGNDTRIPALTKRALDGDIIWLGLTKISCLATPFHTRGDMCYLVESPKRDVRAVFTGDTLYQAGCGAIIEGNYEDMYTVLYNKLAQLPNDTLVFGGHENTLDNLEFAMQLEPENHNLQRRIIWAKQRRGGKYSTMPSTILEEKQWNPFLRVHMDTIQELVKQTDIVQALSKLKALEKLYKDE